MGLIAFTIKAHDDVETVSLSDFWHPDSFWNFLGAVVAQILVVIAGLILLIVPGVILSVSLKFSPFFVIDKGAGPVEALFMSAHVTRGKRWAVFELLVLLAAINIAGLFAFIVGIFVALPVTSLALVRAYRTLSNDAA